MGKSRHMMPFGAEVVPAGVRFRLFAPDLEEVALELAGVGRTPMPRVHDGWFELTSSQAVAGSRYGFVPADGSRLPDPASRFQPEDVHGLSEVIDPEAYEWTEESWRGRPWDEAILYELHVGAFTPEGTFAAAVGKLDHLQRLGVTAIELMAIADFAGIWNWGYDGVQLFAPDSAYGRPEDVKRFVDEAHARGMMVLLDVVYNHFGPEGNYLPRFFSEVSSERHKTPWGRALNFDARFCREARDLIVHNALYWVEEFRMDGLRLDASHRILDDSPEHLLDELRRKVAEAADASGRYIHLILEDEFNTASRLQRDDRGRPVGYTAQWNHDITHLLSAALTPGCTDPTDDAGTESEKLGKALAEGFVIAAQMKSDSEGEAPPTAFVAFIQTHDLIGNRIFGDRLIECASHEALLALSAIYLLLPQIPMMFMGEEWGARTPFPFFCNYHGELAEAVRRGRCDQLRSLDPAPTEDELRRAPDPQAESTFRSAQLQWSGAESDEGQRAFERYRRLLALRKELVVPLLRGLTGGCGRFHVVGPRAVDVQWELAGEARLHLAANLCDEKRPGFRQAQGNPLWSEGEQTDQGEFGPWAIRWSMENGTH